MLQDRIAFLMSADTDVSRYLYVSFERVSIIAHQRPYIVSCFSGVVSKNFTVSTCRPRYISTDLLVNRTYELIRGLLIGILFKKER